MYMNTVLEAWANTLPIPFPVHDPSVLPSEKSGLVTFKSAPGDPNQSTANTMGYGETQQASIDYSAGGKSFTCIYFVCFISKDEQTSAKRKRLL